MIWNVEICSDIIQIHPFTVQGILKVVLIVYLKSNPFDIVSRKRSNFSGLLVNFISCQVKGCEKFENVIQRHPIP